MSSFRAVVSVMMMVAMSVTPNGMHMRLNFSICREVVVVMMIMSKLNSLLLWSLVERFDTGYWGDLI